MAVKKNRVLKRDWAEFFRKFNMENMFKTCVVSMGGDVIGDYVTLAGILYDEDERVMALVSSNDDPDRPCVTLAEVEVPRWVYVILDAEDEHVCGVQFQAYEKSSRVVVELTGNNVQRNRKIWVGNLAQKIYEARDEAEGTAEDDWFRAEAMVEKSVSELSGCRE